MAYWFRMGVLSVGFVFLFSMPAIASDESPAAREAVQLLQQGKRAEAEALLRRRSAAGDDSSTTMLGAILLRTGRAKEAIAVLQPLADRGIADAEWQLCLAYVASSPPDPELARRWRLKAAADGSNEARLATSAPPPPVADAQGKVSTADFVAQMRSAQSAQIQGMNEKTLACYGVPREKLKVAVDKAVLSCAASLPTNQRDRLTESLEFVNQFGACTFSSALQTIGKKVDDLSRCFAK